MPVKAQGTTFYMKLFYGSHIAIRMLFGDQQLLFLSEYLNKAVEPELDIVTKDDSCHKFLSLGTTIKTSYIKNFCR